MKTVYNVTSSALFFLFCCLISSGYFAQLETRHWYFGNHAALDFSTSPPTVTTSAMFAHEGCSTMSDAAGNLLFYSNGYEVFNAQHNIMANGSGLFGNISTTQSSIILKQPGSNSLYYIFTLDCQGWAQGLRYSVIDMTLAAGMGSVTVKNILLHVPSTEKLAATQHCNGVDLWIVSHDYNSNNFRSYLLTAAGLNTTAVMSPVGTMHTGGDQSTQGGMKISPFGSRLGICVNHKHFELYDFNNSTGVVSNPVSLKQNLLFPYSCEFSPDGTKFYGTDIGISWLFQWNLCAGTGTAVVASESLIPSYGMSTMQMAMDGKIYGVCMQTKTLSVMHQPNAAGTACNLVINGLNLNPYTNGSGLPNFGSHHFTPKPKASYTYTASCNTVSFAAVQPTLPSCSATYSVLGTRWRFGDSLSGSADSSFLSQPVHQFSGTGTFTVQMITYFKCSSDTVDFPVTITNPLSQLSVSGNFSICQGEAAVLVATGASSYSWSTGAQSPSIAVAPASFATYTLYGSSAQSCTASKIVTVAVSLCEGMDEIEFDFSFSIFPNPASGLLSINTAEHVRVIITDLNGGNIFHQSFHQGHHDLDISLWSDGIYIAKVISKKQVKFFRIVKKD